MNRKSLKKAITWIVIDNIATITIAYLFTRIISVSIGIAVISNTIEILLYYIHEHCWKSK